MQKRTFTQRFTYGFNGRAVSYRANTELDVPDEVAAFADANGFTKADDAAPENKNLGDAPRRKAGRERKAATAR